MNARQPQYILLVDDHEESLRAMARLLSRNGYTVYTATSLQAARSLAAAKHCDLLISDVSLADGCGLDLMKELGAAFGLRGIAISGHAAPEDTNDARAAGFRDYLVKPVSFTALMDAVGQVLQDGDGRGQGLPHQTGLEGTSDPFLTMGVQPVATPPERR